MIDDSVRRLPHLSDSFLNRPATLFLDSSSLWPVRKKRKPERWKNAKEQESIRLTDHLSNL